MINKNMWGNCLEESRPADPISPKNIGSDDKKEPAFIEATDNHIYFYADIERDKILTLNNKLRSLGTSYHHTGLLENRPPTKINLHINSYGGTIFQGLSGMDNIINCPAPVITIVDGVCASAATFLSVVGTERYITENSYMLIHQLSCWMWGSFRELKDEMQNCDLWMKRIKEIYGKYTKVPMEKIDEILDHDLFIDANQCIEWGLVDGVWKG